MCIPLYFIGLWISVSLMTCSAIGALTFEVRTHPISNLIYQLDCMTETLRCSTEVYKELWQKQLMWKAQDQDRLAQWKNLRLKYQGEIKLDEPPAKPFALPWSGPVGIQLGDKFSIATYHAENRNELKTRLETLVAPSDMELIESTIRYFEPRFSTWWKKTAQMNISIFQKKLSQKINQPEVRKKIEEFAAFYEAQLPKDYSIYLNLFYRPKSEVKGTFATVFENHAAVEVLSGEVETNVLDIVIHEICHFFYGIAPEAKKRQWLEDFANSTNPLSIATHNILNEALATAFGNGIAAELWMEPKYYQERARKERGFYNDTAIDAAAKALIPMLKIDLQNKKTLYSPTFQDNAITVLKNEMPTLIEQPARLLTELVAIYDSLFKESVPKTIRRKLRGGFYSREGLQSNSSWEMLKTYPKLNSILFISPESLDTLKNYRDIVPQKDQALIKDLFKKQTSFLYAIERGPSTYMFIVGGKNNDSIEKEFNRLLEAKSRFVGPLN